MEADGRLCGGREERQRPGLVVKLQCEEQQKQMRVGRTVLSKDMMPVQKLIARTSKQGKTECAC